MKNPFKVLRDQLRLLQETTKRFEKLQATLDGENDWGLEKVKKCVENCAEICNNKRGEPHGT